MITPMNNHSIDPDATIIVTGGLGFIGSNLVAALQRAQPHAPIMVIDDCRSGSFATLVEACERLGAGAFQGEVIAESVGELEWEDLIDATAPRAVFHLAAITDTTVADERLMIDDNTAGFEQMLVACAERQIPLVYASSAATYGTLEATALREPFSEDMAGRPNNVYGFSKWVMENLHRRVTVQLASDSGDVPHVVGLRYFNVFGPGEARKGKMASMAHQIAQQFLSAGRARLFEHGEQARDQVFVDDVVSCTIAAAQPTATPGVYNLGSGRATSFNELATAVRRGLGLGEDSAIEYFPMPESIRAFYQDFTQADLTRTREGLGWKPMHAPVPAIEQYASWLREQHDRTGGVRVA